MVVRPRRQRFDDEEPETGWMEPEKWVALDLHKLCSRCGHSDHKSPECPIRLAEK